MKYLKTLSFAGFSLVLIFVALPQIVFAYLDPVSINFYLQVIAGGLVGIVMGLKFFWNNITGFFGKIFGRGKKTDQTPNK